MTLSFRRFNMEMVHQIQRGHLKAELEQKKLTLQRVCLACLKVTPDLQSHPIFDGGICAECVELLKDVITENELELKFCYICGVARYSVHCHLETCRGVFCKLCIIEYSSEELWLKILKSKEWFCFLCNLKENLCLNKKENWEKNLLEIMQPKIPHFNISRPKKPIRVLSLFDGISAGLIALKKLGLVIEQYFASEIDKDAINISLANSCGKIQHLGNVCSITKETLKKLGPIDLLLGGSPCTDLSLVNPARRGLFDPNGTGILFFEYIRILKEIQVSNGDRGVFFLFENTSAMPKKFKSIISRFFGSEPILIDAKYFCPMKRARLFWGNIPNMDYSELNLEPMNMNLNNYLTDHCGRTSIVEKIRTVTTNRNSLLQGIYGIHPVLMDGDSDSLWINEIETLFGFKEHYTDIGNISISKRLVLVGSSWSVHSVSYLLRKLTDYFEVN